MVQTQIPTAYVDSVWGNRQALVVQDARLVTDTGAPADTGNLAAHVLGGRGYRPSMIGSSLCTRENVLASIDRLVEDSRDDSKTVFYYAGHGYYAEHGFEDDSSVKIVGHAEAGIGPHELFERLGRVRGAKALFIDACFSGRFTDYLARNPTALIRNYVVLASTHSNGIGISAKWRTPADTPDYSPLKGTISNLAYWLFAQHRDYGLVFLNKWPVDVPIDGHDFIVDEELQEQNRRVGIPWPINMEIQRISDVAFDF